jgi:hypothetical protein
MGGRSGSGGIAQENNNIEANGTTQRPKKNLGNKWNNLLCLLNEPR